MEKIKKAIKAISAIIKNPSLLNIILSNDELWMEKVESKYGKGFSLPMVGIDKLSPGFSEKLNCISFLGGGSLPTDIALLKLLCRKFSACKYFEIGTWRGESIINVSEVSEECYTLNLSKSEMKNLGLDEKYIEMNGYFIKNNTKIKQLEGDSMTFDFAQLNQQFDVIFIDGNHHYEYIKNDTEKVFRHLVHDQSVVVWHDYMYTPEKLRPQVMAAILDGTPEKFRQHLYYVSNTMCAIFIRESLPTSAFDLPLVPINVFELEIKSKKYND